MLIPVCTDCDLCFNTGSKPIEPIGDLSKAKVFILLNAPTKKDLLTHKLHITKHLTQLIRDFQIIGFKEEEIYITYRLKCNNFTRLLSEVYILKCKKRFDEEIALFQGKVMVTVGSTVNKIQLGDHFNVYHKMGKLLVSNSSCIMPIVNLTELYNKEEHNTTFRETLVKLYKWYQNNVDINFKSPYEKYTSN